MLKKLSPITSIPFRWEEGIRFVPVWTHQPFLSSGYISVPLMLEHPGQEVKEQFFLWTHGFPSPLVLLWPREASEKVPQLFPDRILGPGSLPDQPCDPGQP